MKVIQLVVQEMIIQQHHLVVDSSQQFVDWVFSCVAQIKLRRVGNAFLPTV